MNILILGSLPEEKGDERDILYTAMIEVCRDFGSVKTPIDTATFEGTLEERYNLVP